MLCQRNKSTPTFFNHKPHFIYYEENHFGCIVAAIPAMTLHAQVQKRLLPRKARTKNAKDSFGYAWFEYCRQS